MTTDNDDQKVKQNWRTPLVWRPSPLV